MIFSKLNFMQILYKIKQIVVFWVILVVVHSDAEYLGKIEAICFFRKCWYQTYQTTLCHNIGDHTVNFRHRKNLTSQVRPL
jgi:hypothetical protein